MEMMGKDFGSALGVAAAEFGASGHGNGNGNGNGLPKAQPGKFALVGSSGSAASASAPAISMDSGSNGSPSRGSDVVMTTPNGRNSAAAAARLQHLDGLGDDPDSPDVVGRRKKRGQRSGGEKGGKGLRHFSMKVCEKVESKGRTSYNEVADELVAEFANPDSMLVSPDQQQYDEKNIRRRVYDALNVLMAVEIISKEKKEIQWKGLPSTSVNDIEQLKAERIRVRSRIEKKAAYLQELEEQIIGIQNLVQRNERLYNGTGNFPAGGVALPFILVQTRPQATVEVEISEDMQLVHFDFNSTPFELHDDAYVLKSMNFCEHAGSPEGIGRVDSEDGLDGPYEEEASPVSNLFPHACNHTPRAAYGGPYSSFNKGSTSPPVPSILKAKVKHENYT